MIILAFVMLVLVAGLVAWVSYKLGCGDGHRRAIAETTVYQCRCACCHERFEDKDSFAYMCPRCSLIGDKAWAKLSKREFLL